MIGAYTFARVVLIVGGFKVHGFGPDAAIEIEDQEEGELIVGADGEASFSISADESRIVNITIMPTSSSYRTLAELARAQRKTLAGQILPVPFSLTDLNNGDSMNGLCLFMNLPFPSKGKRVSPVTFKIALPKPTEKAGLTLIGI